MPLLTLHLLRLSASAPPLADFLALLQSSAGTTVVVASAPQHVVIEPTALDRATLLAEPWDVLLLLQTPDAALPTALQAFVASEYRVRCGIPSSLMANYPARNAELRAQPARLTGSLDAALKARDVRGGEKLELSEALIAFMRRLEARGGGPVTMLNLLHFNPGAKPEYAKYGQAFKGVAGRRGGDAKIVGNVVSPPTGQRGLDARGDRGAGEWWDEVSLVHYPSIGSFCDMLAGEDYQEINARHRLGALKDTFLLCTTESLLNPLAKL